MRALQKELDHAKTMAELAERERINIYDIPKKATALMVLPFEVFTGDPAWYILLYLTSIKIFADKDICIFIIICWLLVKRMYNWEKYEYTSNTYGIKMKFYWEILGNRGFC
jgi:hypothetical protein